LKISYAPIEAPTPRAASRLPLRCERRNRATRVRISNSRMIHSPKCVCIGLVSVERLAVKRWAAVCGRPSASTACSAARYWSCRRPKILANHPRVTSRDSQETDGRTFWFSSALFPVSERVHTDAHRLGELGLRKADEAPESSDVLPGLDLPSHQTLAHTSRNRASQLFLGKFRNVSHSAAPWTWLR